MLFNSFAFGLFFVIVFAIYWISPQKYRYLWLLVTSLYFYISFNPVYIVLLFTTMLVTYFCAIYMEKTEDRIKRKRYLLLALLICLGILFVFKYYNFASNSICNVISLFGIELAPTTIKWALPIGISFYTFQTLGYLIDVYKGNIRAEKHFAYYALFVSYFPQIASGPIGRANSLLPQLKSEIVFDYDKAVKGVLLIIWGFYKKLVVADTLSVYVDKVFNNPDAYAGGASLIAAVFYSIQIYCDFSGYSDIAIGVSKLLGIDLMENFRSPYFSSSIKEFWSRWHISLSTWFRDYVYIPLGGNRCSKVRRDINLMITFMVSGLWHGANWTFILWGGLHGLGQIIENHIPSLHTKKYGFLAFFVKWLKIVLVFSFATVCWVFFRADSIADGFSVISNIFVSAGSLGEYVTNGMGNIGIPGNIRLLYILMILFVLVVTDAVNYNGKFVEKVLSLPRIPRWLVIVSFAAFTIIFAQKGVAAKFVYLQF